MVLVKGSDCCLLTISLWRHAHWSSWRTKTMIAKHKNWCLLTCQRILPMVFNRFNQAMSWLKELTNHTIQISPNRTRKNSTNQTNQKRLIPIEHTLSVIIIRASILATTRRMGRGKVTFPRTILLAGWRLPPPRYSRKYHAKWACSQATRQKDFLYTTGNPSPRMTFAIRRFVLQGSRFIDFEWEIHFRFQSKNTQNVEKQHREQHRTKNSLKPAKNCAQISHKTQKQPHV